MVKKIAFLFPGQGSQSVGMGKNIFEKFPKTTEVLKEADDILGYSLSSLMANGPEEDLRQTNHTQPALFVASAGAAMALKELGLEPTLAAGHSLGEYSALCAAGVFSFEDGLKLVQARGNFMAEAGKSTEGGMAALIGLDEEKTKALCEEAAAQTSEPCVPANFNSGSQIVISGGRKAIDFAVQNAKGKGALKAIPLNVSGAFHSPLMKSAAEKMKSVIDSVSFLDARFPVVTNVDAQPTVKGAEFKEKLFQQIDHAVLWTQTMPVLTAEAEAAVEAGSGKVLSSLLKKFDRKFPVYMTDAVEEIEKNLIASV